MRIEEVQHVFRHPVLCQGALVGRVTLGTVLVLEGLGHHHVPRHVVFRALVGLTQQTGHIGQCHRAVGLHRERQLVHVHRELQRRGQRVQHEEIADSIGLVLGPVDDLPKLEGFFPVPITQPAGFLAQTGRGQETFPIVEVDGGYAWCIGRHRDMVIRNALGHPQGRRVIGTGTGNLEEPQLVLVGHRQTFSAIAIAILLGQGSHQLHRLTGGGAALQSQRLEVLDVEHPFGIDQLLPAHDGRLAHGQLLLVHTGIAGTQKGVGVGHLRDRTFQNHAQTVVLALCVANVPIDVHFRRIRPVLRGHHLHPGARGAIARGRGNDRPVHRSLTASGNACTTLLGIGQLDHPLLCGNRTCHS